MALNALKFNHLASLGLKGFNHTTSCIFSYAMHFSILFTRGHHYDQQLAE